MNRMQFRQGEKGAHKLNRGPKLVGLPMGPINESITVPWDDFCHNKLSPAPRRLIFILIDLGLPNLLLSYASYHTAIS